MPNPAFDSTAATTVPSATTTNTTTSTADPQLITHEPGFCANCNQKCGPWLRCLAPFMIFFGFFLIPACVIVLFVLPKVFDDSEDR